jgi:hypothetical protein
MSRSILSSEITTARGIKEVVISLLIFFPPPSIVYRCTLRPPSMACYTVLFSFLLFFSTYAQIQTPPPDLLSGFVRFSNATRQVSWFYAQNGLVAYDGDVIFGTVSEFNNALINITYSSPNATIPRRRRNVPFPDTIAKRSDSIWPGSAGIWPGGKVYYRYWDANTESQLSQYVDGAIASWTAAVPCISFVKLANDNDPLGSNGIVTIQAHSPNVGYCLATSIGYTTNSLWMQLDTGGGCGIPEVTHEFGKWKFIVLPSIATD